MLNIRVELRRNTVSKSHGKELNNITEAVCEYVRMFDPEQTEGIIME